MRSALCMGGRVEEGRVGDNFNDCQDATSPLFMEVKNRIAEAERAGPTICEQLIIQELLNLPLK